MLKRKSESDRMRRNGDGENLVIVMPEALVNITHKSHPTKVLRNKGVTLMPTC